MPTTTFRMMPCCASVRMTMLASQPMMPPTISVMMMFMNIAPYMGQSDGRAGGVLLHILPRPDIGSPIGPQCEKGAKGSRPCRIRPGRESGISSDRGTAPGRRHGERKSVVEGKSVAVRVDTGGRRNTKKKQYEIPATNARK